MLDLLKKNLLRSYSRRRRYRVKPCDKRFIRPRADCGICGAKMVHSLVNVAGRDSVSVPLGCESKECSNYIGHVFKTGLAENLIISNQSDIK